MDYELIPDEDTLPRRKVVRSKAKEAGYKGEEVNPLFLWGQEKLGGKRFTNPIKQKTHIKRMLYSGYNPVEIKELWESLEEDKFWGEKGVDFGVVESQIGKVKFKKKSNSLLYAQR